MSEIREITGSEDAPIAWSHISRPKKLVIEEDVFGAGLVNATYHVAVSYATLIEPYSVAILSPEWDVFV